MTTFRNVATATAQTFFMSFPEDQKPVVVRDNESIAIYKAVSGMMTIAIFKTTYTVKTARKKQRPIPLYKYSQVHP